MVRLEMNLEVFLGKDGDEKPPLFSTKVEDLNTSPSKIFIFRVGSSRVDLQACKLEYSIVSPK